MSVSAAQFSPAARRLIKKKKGSGRCNTALAAAEMGGYVFENKIYVVGIRPGAYEK